MVFVNGALFLLTLFLMVKSAEFSNRFASRVARAIHMSEFLVSFLIIAVISVFPETTVAIISGIEGIPEFGLGTLLGSNIADLTLILGIVALSTRDGIRVKSEIINRDLFYLMLLSLPVLLGLDSHLSRADGLILILGCLGFFFAIYADSRKFTREEHSHNNHTVINFILLAISITGMLVTGYFTVNTGIAFAQDLHIPPVLLSLIVVAIGTCMPEFIFSLKAVQRNHNTIAIGDILGTVIIDATFVIGILALIRPFSFDPLLAYFTGMVMVIAGLLVMIFLKTERRLSKKEAIILLLFYVSYLAIQVLILAGSTTA